MSGVGMEQMERTRRMFSLICASQTVHCRQMKPKGWAIGLAI